MSCQKCFIDTIANCETEVQVNAQLTPTTEYTWIITDKFGSKYSGQSTTDADGFFTIPIEDLPAGLLNNYAGDFTLEIQDTHCTPIRFKMMGEYDCVNFTVTSGTYEKNNLGCDFDCVNPVS